MSKTREADERLIAVRLGRDEIDAIDAAVRVGVAENSSDAIRIALRYLPRAVTAKFLDEDLPRHAALLDVVRSMTLDAGTIEIEPHGIIAIAAGQAQPLLASVKTRRGDIVPNARVDWQLVPHTAGRIVVDRDTTHARFVAGRQPGTAVLRAVSGPARSREVEVLIWPADGIAVGFRQIGGGFPRVSAPKPRAFPAATRRAGAPKEPSNRRAPRASRRAVGGNK